ncbi:hypothetical protein INS49_009113 [Diaporthe citri]|uniref:uncharacterized protein n=1 Tax=Diaporthe citri TaxID=83186 RepID=UPI001C82715D|nr:uncharacterized protein INS49_009113 [Diaporthe citri]KAG6364010.1 hypothetical protein INS49_009113 [Diaporthe citri]
MPQEGLLAIIMDVCKLHVNDALHDLQRPAEPVRTSTFGTIPTWERKTSYLELDSSDEEDEAPGASAPRISNVDTSDWEKVSPLPLRARPRRKSKEHNDQWATEKEQTKTHLTEIIKGHIGRHMYLIRLCRALMLYGAPTHRLEEYMSTSAQAIRVNAQFLYAPNCMLISFLDKGTQTTKMTMVTSPQGIDLGRMRCVHEIYLNVLHDAITFDEGTGRLEEVMSRERRYCDSLCVLMYGCACACVAPFGFLGRWVDLPVAFVLGCVLGLMQLYFARNRLFSNVFEIVASIVISFLARAFGSIRGGGLFCFSALAQAGIALILPGYMILCASLELQTRHLIAGATRMMYAIIYTLFLGYGITIGSVLYGALDKDATSETACSAPLPKEWNLLFVSLFTICVAIINQARWEQMPAMLLISVSGYAVNWHAGYYFKGASTVSNTLGAMAIGDVEGGGCSGQTNSGPRDIPQQTHPRVGYGVAGAAMLPAIFVQVPSGLAVGGSLLAGIKSADWIISEEVGESAVEDLTASTDIAMSVTTQVIQVAISISVGLSISALLVNLPLDYWRKRKAGISAF